MLHTEVSKLWSRGIIQLFTGSRAQYDQATNSLTKHGDNLKVDDRLLRLINEEGKLSSDFHQWKVSELLYQEALSISHVKVGEEYGVFLRERQAVEPFQLEKVDLNSKVSMTGTLSRTLMTFLNSGAHKISFVDVQLQIS